MTLLGLYNYITTLRSTVLLSLFHAVRFSPNFHPGQTHLNSSRDLHPLFCICLPFITAAASWGGCWQFPPEETRNLKQSDLRIYLSQDASENLQHFQAGGWL